VLPQLVALLNDPDTPVRCRTTAEERLDLERVGWPRYRQLYDQLASAPVGGRPTGAIAEG
jgi:hypothetical protein